MDECYIGNNIFEDYHKVIKNNVSINNLYSKNINKINFTNDKNIIIYDNCKTILLYHYMIIVFLTNIALII